jgi:predicted enzyme related to lactoylglutathione lyase
VLALRDASRKRRADDRNEEDVVFERLPGLAWMAMASMSIALGCRPAHPKAAVHYVEIVSNDADAVIALYQSTHGLSFGAPDPDLGQARVATEADGTLVGIRKPLAAHEHPIMRTYFAVDNIQQAVKKAEEHGATVAYPPTRQGQRGTFAIVIAGDVEHGLWQR